MPRVDGGDPVTDAAFDRAVRVLAEPPGWLRAAVDGDAMLGTLRRDAAGLDEPAERRVRLEGVDPEDVVACTPLDVRLGAGGWRGWYALSVRDPGHADGPPRRVEVTGALHPPAGGSAFSASLRPVADGADLPALEVLTDSAAVAALLERVVGGVVWPGYRVTGCTPTVVRHARGARATVVLRVDLPAEADPRWPRTVVAKAYADDGGASTHAAMTALWETGLTTSDVVRIAAPLGYDAASRVLLQGAVPDVRSLTRLITETAADGGPAALDRLHLALHRTADGLVALHACGARGGEQRGPDVLVTRVLRAGRRLGDVLPGGPATVDALVAPLVPVAAEHPTDPPVPSHGGFRPAQVLLDDDDRPGFVDLDGYCRAEPAFDLGRFRARLREIVLAVPGGRDAPLSPGRRRLADGLADAFLDRYAAGAPVSLRRVEVWERLELVTALVQSWTRAQLDRTAPLAVLLGADPPAPA